MSSQYVRKGPVNFMSEVEIVSRPCSYAQATLVVSFEAQTTQRVRSGRPGQVARLGTRQRSRIMRRTQDLLRTANQDVLGTDGRRGTDEALYSSDALLKSPSPSQLW